MSKWAEHVSDSRISIVAWQNCRICWRRSRISLIVNRSYLFFHYTRQLAYYQVTHLYYFLYWVATLFIDRFLSRSFFYTFILNTPSSTHNCTSEIMRPKWAAVWALSTRRLLRSKCNCVTYRPFTQSSWNRTRSGRKRRAPFTSQSRLTFSHGPMLTLISSCSVSTYERVLFFQIELRRPSRHIVQWEHGTRSGQVERSREVRSSDVKRLVLQGWQRAGDRGRASVEGSDEWRVHPNQ